jgi:hypothetical protein
MNKLINDYEKIKIEHEKKNLLNIQLFDKINRQMQDLNQKEEIIDNLEKRFEDFFFEEKLNTLKLVNDNIMLEKTIFLLEKQIKDQEEIIQNERLNIINLTNDNKILTEKLEKQLKVHKKTEIKKKDDIFKNFFRY